MKNSKYIVAIQVLTYNQKDYIAQCLDSIVDQRTTFPFVVVVYDDASTDGTADIVRQYAERYPDIIHPILQTENQYSQGKSPAKIAADEINLLNPKYKCVLDGDDYWTDMESLQMRYDYLEAHSDCAVVYTKFERLLMPEGKVVETDYFYESGIPTFEDMLFRNTISISTAMFRLDVYREYLADVKPFEQNWAINDWAIWLYMMTKHQLGFIDKNTSMYRELSVSISRKKTLWERVRFINNRKQIPLYFCQYSKKPGIRKDVEQHYNKLIRKVIIDEIKKRITKTIR